MVQASLLVIAYAITVSRAGFAVIDVILLIRPIFDVDAPLPLGWSARNLFRIGLLNGSDQGFARSVELKSIVVIAFTAVDNRVTILRWSLGDAEEIVLDSASMIVAVFSRVTIALN